MLEQHSSKFLDISLQVYFYTVLTHDLAHLLEKVSIINLMDINIEVVHPECIVAT